MYYLELTDSVLYTNTHINSRCTFFVESLPERPLIQVGDLHAVQASSQIMTMVNNMEVQSSVIHP